MTVDAERAVQSRIVELLRKEFGFEYRGNLKDFDNANINERVLRAFLVEKQKLNESQAASVVMKLNAAAQCTSFDDLYNANKAVYQMLRYPVQVATEPGKPSKQVQLIDRDHESVYQAYRYWEMFERSLTSTGSSSTWRNSSEGAGHLFGEALSAVDNGWG